MANFYISDLHFGCVSKYDGRTLETDKMIKENWNKVVTNADTVYILGDVGRAGTNKENEYLASFLAALKGKKVLIKGNHDRVEDIRIKQQFTEICDYKEIIDNFEGNAYKLVQRQKMSGAGLREPNTSNFMNTFPVMTTFRLQVGQIKNGQMR